MNNIAVILGCAFPIVRLTSLKIAFLAGLVFLAAAAALALGMILGQTWLWGVGLLALGVGVLAHVRALFFTQTQSHGLGKLFELIGVAVFFAIMSTSALLGWIFM